MPFPRPTLAALVDRVRGDLRGRLEVLGPLLRRAMADVLGVVWAGAIHGLYGYLDWLSKQFFARTAERESLLEMAAPYGMSLEAATYAAGNIEATGTDGTPIPIDTILRLDATTTYRVTAGQVIAGGVATLPVAAVLAGAAGNIEDGTKVTFDSVIAGVNSTAEADGDIEGGNDEEDIEDFRTRFLERLREPPEGGADQDYVAWAREVPGVTRAWTYPNENGLGTVVVRFVRDNDVSIFPDAGAVAAVQAKLEAERPITAEVTAAAPTDLPLDFTIALDPDNAETRAAVSAELTDLLRRVGAPGDVNGRGTAKLSQLRTAVGTAEGVEDYTMTVPAADVVPGVGQLLTLGVVTWI